MVLGVNEAGKSTALAAIGDALFGFGHRTEFDFLHGAPNLRIGFTLAARDGTTACFVRRKGRPDTLRDAADQPVAEAALAGFLGGVTREQCEHAFGLDGARLHQGGEELLRLGGEAGESLLAAGGLLNLRAALTRLEDEAKSLVGDGRGRRRLSDAVEAWRKAQREAEDRSVPPRARQDAEAAQAEAVAALAAVQAQIRTLAAENNRLQRVRRVAPLLAQLACGRRTLADLADAPHLPADAEARFQALLAARRDAKRDQVRETAEAQRLTAARAALPQDAAVLAAQDAIDALLARRAVALEAAADLPNVQAEAAAGRASVPEAIAELGLDRAPEAACDALPPTPARMAVQRLISRHAALSTEAHAAARDLAAGQRRRDQAAEALAREAEPPSPALLRRTIDAVRGEGQLDTELSRAERALAAADQAATAALAALPVWTGDMAALIACPVPLPAEADRLAGQLDTAAQALAEARKATTGLTAALAETEDELTRLAQGGTVPTPEAVAAARAQRDKVWHRLRTRLDGTAPDDRAPSPVATAPLRASSSDAGAAPLDAAFFNAATVPLGADSPGAVAAPQDTLAEAASPDTFEALRDEADRLADRRVDEAHRVEAFLAGRTRRDLLRARHTVAQAALESAQTAAAGADAAWQAVWAPAGIAPLSPPAMAEWRRARAEVLRLAEAAATARQQRDDVAGRRGRALGTLAALLPEAPAPESLTALLLHAETACAAAEAAATAYRTRKQTLAEAEARLPELCQAMADAAAALDAWQHQWAAAVQALVLPADATVELAETALAAWARIAEAAQAWRTDAARIGSMEAAVAAFAADVQAIRAHLADPASDEPAPVAAARLGRRLTEARKAATEAAELAKRIASHASAAAEAARRLGAADTELEALRTLAGVTDDAALAQAIERAHRRDAVAAALTAAEQALRAQGDGLPEDALQAEAAQVEPDAVAGRVAELDSESAKLARRVEELTAQRTKAEQVLEAMPAGHDAATMAQQAEDALAEARAAAERYARLHVARVLLRAGIERFRKQQQGPLLRGAGAHFALLTGGRYERLIVDYDASGRPVLLVC